jgi:DNA modification methylase
MERWLNRIHQGDAVDLLAEIPERSVHMCMTSPPYFGLRDYDVEGQVGLEDSLDEYIQELVGVGDELQRVLRDDGSWWLNLGDSFENKQKQLVPHKVASTLQTNGWIVRNDVTWYKPNPMPSSVTDRLNTTTEQIFHLTPSRQYWYDLHAIREPYEENTIQRRQHHETDRTEANDSKGGAEFAQHTFEQNLHPSGKNPGDVFEVTVQPYPDAHFAVYPPELCTKPIKATCPPKVCTECGAPYERDVTRETGTYDYSDRKENVKGRIQSSGTMLERPTAEHNGWDKCCECETDETEAGIALDPFCGSGTTCMVAKNHQRQFIGIDLNEEYVSMAQDRVGVSVDNPDHLRDDSQEGIEMFASGSES